MPHLADRMHATVSWVLFPPDERGRWVQLSLLMVAVAVFVCLAGALVSVGVVLALSVGLILVLGPSRLMVGLFILFMMATHQFMSFFTVPLAGVVWHPREFLLFILLAHWAVKLVQGKIVFRFGPLHLCVTLYACFFAFAALVGLYHGYGLGEIISESRNPLFLISFPVLASLVQTRKDLELYIRFITWVTIAIAIAALTFFAYAMLSHNLVQTNQTPFGEFMKTAVGPILVQTVRPNGHMFFEICIVVAASLLLCPDTPMRKRTTYLLLIALLSAAVAITTMRTAYAIVLISIGFLAFLSIPSRQFHAMFIGLAIVTAVTVSLLYHQLLYDMISTYVPRLDLSLKGRLVEIQGAWVKLMENPVIGAGLGSYFEGLGLVQTGEQLAAGSAEYHTMHNTWVYFLFKGGLVGFLMVALGLGGIVGRGYGLLFSIQDTRDRYLLRGLVAALAGQLVAGLAMPRLTYPSGYVMIAMFATAFLILASEDFRPAQQDTTAPGRLDDPLGA